MTDPFKMVFINIIASALVLTGTFVYRFIYPKKKINLFALLLIISILPIISIFRAGDYESGDFNIHIYRIMSFYDSLMEGHLMPSWAGELNATYGNPLFIFNYSLPYYGISFFHFIGLSFISGMKVYLGLNLYSSGIFMYLWVRKLTANKLAAFTAAIFYIFNPYHLIDVHFRATLGESTIFTLAPLLLLFITLYIKERKLIYLAITALACQLLFLAHPLVAFTIFGISILFVFSTVNVKKEFKNILLLTIALIFGAFASLYSWFSFILFSPFMFPKPGADVVWQFDKFSQLIYSPWRFGLLFQGPSGELSWILGYTQIFVVISAIFLLIKNKLSDNLKHHCIFWLAIFFLILFFMMPFSQTVWSILPHPLLELESNRLLLPLALCTSVLAGYLSVFLHKNKKMFIYFLLFLTIGYTILNWGHRRLVPQIDDAALRKNVWISTVAEGTTAYFLNNKWADVNNFWFTKLPGKHLEILKGEATVKEIKRTSTQHYYLIDAKTPLVIQENTLFYPGWSLISNNKHVTIYPGKRGIITGTLPQGLQKVQLTYSDIPAYAIAKIISLISLLGLLSIIILYYLFAFLPIHNISPGKRKTQVGFNIKTGLRNFMRYERK